MRRSLARAALSAVLASGVLIGGMLTGASTTAAHATAPRHCLPTDGRVPETATPEQVGMDSAALRHALDLTADLGRTNIQIYRFNCLIAGIPGNRISGGVPWNLWSGTKSVVSLVVGIAADEGYLRLNDPIGRYLPAGVGDAAHRAITIRDILIEASGLRIAVASEGVTGVLGLDPDIVAQAMAMPIVRPPGSTYLYSQRAVDLLVNVTQHAVGMDFQAFAQRKLFGPLGIQQHDYYWARDRSGNTYGYAHLLMPPDDYAKLGLLLLDNGSWHGIRVVSQDYLRAATSTQSPVGCYGYFILTDGGCGQLSAAPADAFAMTGMMGQDNVVVPSLGLLVTWTGLTGVGTSVLSSHEVTRAITRAFREPRVPDPGPYLVRPDIPVTDPQVSDMNVALGLFGLGPDTLRDCNVLVCLGRVPAPPQSDWPPGCLVLACVGPDPRTPGIR